MGLGLLAGLFLLTAAFVWIMKSYGAEFGFLALGLLFFALACIFHFAARPSKKTPIDDEPEMDMDLLAQYLPEEMQNDPRILAVIENIKEHPVGSTATAVSLGFVLSKLILRD